MKVIYDTCIYIDFLRSSLHQDVFLERNHIRYLSPVVMMELLAGAKSVSEKKLLNQLFHPYLKANRIISLSSQHYYKVGEILANFQHEIKTRRPNFSHDVMIAMSCYAVGATLFTANKSDFQKITEYIDIKIDYI